MCRLNVIKKSGQACFLNSFALINPRIIYIIPLLLLISTSVLAAHPDKINAVLPCVSIDDITVTEGSIGTQTVYFTITVDVPSPDTLSLGWYNSVVPNRYLSAVTSSDYLPGINNFSTNIIILPGETVKKIPIIIVGDHFYEPNQQFLFVLTQRGKNYTICKKTGTCTILDDDPKPILTVSDTTIVEGNDGQKMAYFMVKLNICSDYPISLDYELIDGSAIDGQDFIKNSGRLTIEPKKTGIRISIPVIGDNIVEPDEEFFLKISNPENAIIGKEQGRGLILNNDNRTGKPFLSVSDVIVDEESGKATFKLKLSNASTDNISISYATNDGSILPGAEYSGVAGVAENGFDYTAVSGVINFPSGTTLQNLDIPIINDTESEYLESFVLNLTNTVNVIMVDYQAKASIRDNDIEVPIIRFDTTKSVGEDESELLIEVTLNTPYVKPVNVNYSTESITTTPDEDFSSSNGILTFLPGETYKTISIPIISNPNPESNETFALNFSNPVNATLEETKGTYLIRDATIQFANITILDLVVNEFTSSAVFTVFYDGCADELLSLEYETADGTATAGNDYVSTSGSVYMGAGCNKVFSVAVPLINDSLVEGNETFYLKWDEHYFGTFGNSTKVTIVDNDPESTPEIKAVNTVFNESDGKQKIEVTLSAPSTEEVRVSYQPEGFSATTGTDYYLVPGWAEIVFKPGEISKTVELWLVGDSFNEVDEYFNIFFYNPVNAILNNDLYTYTIIDDDPKPTISISDVTVNEVDGTLDFIVQLNGATQNIVYVDFSTANNTAEETDYVQSSGTIPFYYFYNYKQQLIKVPIIDDNVVESIETFFVNLSNAVNAIITDEQGEGTIVDNDQTALTTSTAPPPISFEAPKKTTNVFTPNGDGVNDLFYLEGIENIPNEITIINKSGRQIFKQLNYKNDWDGAGAPDGTYFYFLKTKGDDGKAVLKKGFVTVLRQQSK